MSQDPPASDDEPAGASDDGDDEDSSPDGDEPTEISGATAAAADADESVDGASVETGSDEHQPDDSAETDIEASAVADSAEPDTDESTVDGSADDNADEPAAGGTDSPSDAGEQPTPDGPAGTAVSGSADDDSTATDTDDPGGGDPEQVPDVEGGTGAEAGKAPDVELAEDADDSTAPETEDGAVPEDVRKYDRFKKVDGSEYERVNEFLRERTYVTAREWAIARLCADFRTETGVEMTKIGENLPYLIPFMTDTYSPQAVNQARASFEEKVRKSGATFLYGAMCDFFTPEELDELMYEVTEVAKFLLEVEGVELAVEEELEAEDEISAVMREVREASEALRYDECPHCGHDLRE